MNKKISIILLCFFVLFLPQTSFAVLQSHSYLMYDNRQSAQLTSVVTPPSITDVASSVFDGGANISWSTGAELTDGLVTYSTSQSFADSLEHGSLIKDTTTHLVVLTGLKPSTTYYFKVQSTNLAGGSAIANNNYSFTTPAATQALSSTVNQAVGGGGIAVIVDKTDKKKPEISQVMVRDITEYGVTITWKTNKLSTSFVNYEGRGVGKVSGAWDDVVEHTVTLNDLSPGTKYVIEPMSSDFWGNLGVGEKATFVTKGAYTANEKIPSEPINSTSSPEILAPYFDRYGNYIYPSMEKGSSSTKNTKIMGGGMGSGLKVGVVGLLQQLSSLIKGRTEGLTDGELESTLNGYKNIFKVLLPRLPGLRIVGQPRVAVESDRATIYWSTDQETISQVAYADQYSYFPERSEPYSQIVGDAKVSSRKHEMLILGLSPDTTYYYQVRDTTLFGAITKTENYTFKTLKKKLEIDNYEIKIISNDKAIVRWLTSYPTDTALRFVPYKGGALANSEAKVIYDKELTKIHQVEMTDLDKSLYYQLELSGTDAQKRIATKTIYDFSTNKSGDIAPAISQIRTELSLINGREDKAQAFISWQTDISANSKLYYHLGAGVFNPAEAESVTDPEYVRNHAILINKFKPGLVYSYLIESTSVSGKKATSTFHTVLVPVKKKSIFDIIFEIIKSLFGWMNATNK